MIVDEEREIPGNAEESVSTSAVKTRSLTKAEQAYLDNEDVQVVFPGPNWRQAFLRWLVEEGGGELWELPRAVYGGDPEEGRLFCVRPYGLVGSVEKH